MTLVLGPDDILAPAPARLSDILIGYARISTGAQSLDRQIDALTSAGCRRIFADEKSGKNALRPELKACHAFIDPGDTLVVPSLDRYGRSLVDLITMVGELRGRDVGFRSLYENLDTTTPGGRLVFHVFAALSEFIRELIVDGTREGLAAARARGRVGGRPKVVDADLLRAARDLLPNPRPQHHLDRQTARRQRRDPVQPHPRPAGAARHRPRTRPRDRPGEGLSWLAYVDESIRPDEGVRDGGVHAAGHRRCIGARRDARAGASTRCAS
ncbi:Site-specific DNA recombinase [Jiangella alkaliphila]|uniref:Site-specific DNA recombinase n=1 Tax=Jiangella alkaliphila TaxID=419479 RepID=A0A1H2L700_9ACTN|nr:recombinase family protein [Jiangella alkaliphila]SDU76820.1 Site-specific DNA recombinase [Jiangella alkaliphila]